MGLVDNMQELITSILTQLEPFQSLLLGFSNDGAHELVVVDNRNRSMLYRGVWSLPIDTLKELDDCLTFFQNKKADILN